MAKTKALISFAAHFTYKKHHNEQTCSMLSSAPIYMFITLLTTLLLKRQNSETKHLLFKNLNICITSIVAFYADSLRNYYDFTAGNLEMKTIRVDALLKQRLHQFYFEYEINHILGKPTKRYMPN